jgi:hypothetical protein
MDAPAGKEPAIMITPLSLAAQISLGLACGLIAGLLHFSSLRRNVQLLADGFAARALTLQGARLGALLVILFVLAKLGPWALLCGAAALLAARWTLLRRVRREAR